jgi:hypothetical protein
MASNEAIVLQKRQVILVGKIFQPKETLICIDFLRLFLRENGKQKSLHYLGWKRFFFDSFQEKAEGYF